LNYYQEDTFVEELVVRRNNLGNLLIQILFVLGAIVLAAACFLFLSGLFPALLAILVAGAYLGIKFQGVEYEYSFTNGELDIDKIMAKRKRKRLVEIDHKQIQVMAPYTAEYESETKDYQVTQVIDTSSHKNAPGRWFFIYENQEGKYVFVVFQPSKRLREAMRKYMRSRIKGMDE
jgi:hypothetical protein